MDSRIDLDAFVHAAGDAAAADNGGRITLWNPAAEQMFGFSAEDAVGNSLDLIIRRRHWDAYRQTMSSGITKYGREVLRVPAVHRNGYSFSIAFTVTLLPSPSDGVAAIVAVIRDDTERWSRDNEQQSHDAKSSQPRTSS